MGYFPELPGCGLSGRLGESRSELMSPRILDHSALVSTFLYQFRQALGCVEHHCLPSASAVQRTNRNYGAAPILKNEYAHNISLCRSDPLLQSNFAIANFKIRAHVRRHGQSGDRQSARAINPHRRESKLLCRHMIMKSNVK